MAERFLAISLVLVAAVSVNAQNVSQHVLDGPGLSPHVGVGPSVRPHVPPCRHSPASPSCTIGVPFTPGWKSVASCPVGTACQQTSVKPATCTCAWVPDCQHPGGACTVGWPFTAQWLTLGKCPTGKNCVRINNKPPICACQ